MADNLKAEVRVGLPLTCWGEVRPHLSILPVLEAGVDSTTLN
jgi:hypothetical protein